MSYETENWAKLSPRFREAHNRLRVARGEPAIPPPKVDLYVQPPPQPVRTVEVVDSELRAEYRAATSRFDMMLRNGAEGFQVKGGKVEGLEVVELPNGMGYEGVREGRKGNIQITEGFSIRR